MAVSRPSHPQLSRKSRELVSLPVARYTAHPLAAMAEQAADQGHAANERGDHAAARQHFLDAYRLSSKPQFLLSAANMSLKIGSFDEAPRRERGAEGGAR